MEILLKSFTFITLLIILINKSHCDHPIDAELKEECDIWNNYCKRAWAQSNENFQCLDEVIYFYESESTEWDEARHVCSLKFGGSYLADLVQIPENKKSSTIKMLKNLGREITPGTEIATGGACCMKKLQDKTFGVECEWLTTGTKVPDSLSDGVLGVSDKCKIITIKFDGTNLKGFASKEKSGAELPFLCSFHLPDKCTPVTPKPTTTTETPSTPTTSTPTTQAPHSSPSDKPKETTISTPENTPSTDTFSLDQHLEDIHEELDDHENLDAKRLVEISKRLRNVLDVNTMEKNTTLMLTMQIVSKIETHSNLLDNEQDKLIEFSNNMVESVSRVLDADHAWERMENTDKQIEMSSDILNYIQKTGFNMGCRQKSDTKTRLKSKIITPNVIVKTFTMDYSKGFEFEISGKDSSISVPAGIPEPELEDKCSEGTVVGSMFDKLSRYLSQHLDENHEINSNIVAFSIQDSKESTLLPNNVSPVRVVVEHHKMLELGDRVDCVYWDFKQMNWSSNGCHFVEINSNRKLSICECNHLTNFAALMDVSGRETNTKVKDILTNVCCGLSIICLILTIVFFTLIRALRNRRNNITSNLCFCLLIVNLLVVFGMDSTQNNGWCQTVAAFLLYFILCSFSWMLMEGYHLYQMIVLVFSNVGHLRLIYLYAIGYGAPLLIAFSAYLGIGFKNLKETDSYFCWISSPSHPYRVWAVAGPATVAILANALIMFLALKEAFSAKIKKKLCEKDFCSDSPNIAERLSQSFSWIKGFISLVVVLGITWISFLLYIHRFGQFFSYIFIILNGLQGVFIFIFQILLNEKARSVVRKACHKRLPSRYLSSLNRTTSTNVFTSTMRSKSISRDKSSSDVTNSSSGDPNNGNNKKNKSNDANNSTIGSHRSQSISMNRIRNASDSILF